MVESRRRFFELAGAWSLVALGLNACTSPVRQEPRQRSPAPGKVFPEAILEKLPDAFPSTIAFSLEPFTPRYRTSPNAPYRWAHFQEKLSSSQIKIIAGHGGRITISGYTSTGERDLLLGENTFLGSIQVVVLFNPQQSVEGILTSTFYQYADRPLGFWTGRGFIEGNVGVRPWAEILADNKIAGRVVVRRLMEELLHCKGEGTNCPPVVLTVFGVRQEGGFEALQRVTFTKESL